MSLRSLSQTVPQVTQQVCARKYIMLGRLVTQWTEIMGEDLAHKTQPVKLRYMKKRDKQKGPATATLDISSSSAEATVLHYRKDLILERINQIFGERWVTAIRFVPEVSNKSAPVRRKRSASLSMQNKKYLAEMLENIGDPDIYERLESMGQSLIQDQKS